MFAITTSDSQDTSVTVLPGKALATVRIRGTIVENDPALIPGNVAAVLNWNDGTPAVDYGPSPGTLILDVTRALPVGQYFIGLTGHNYRSPDQDISALYFKIEVLPEQKLPVPQRYIYGPIIPLDTGFPNAQQWNFNTADDLSVLQSSVKTLLLTVKGERVMNPNYGTRLQRVVFEPDTGGVQTIVQQEIIEAINSFEDRVSLESFTVQRVGPRDVLVTARFLSRLNQTSFELELPFSQ